MAHAPDSKPYVNDGGDTIIPNTLFYYDQQTRQSQEILNFNDKTITYYGVLNK